VYAGKGNQARDQVGIFANAVYLLRAESISRRIESIQSKKEKVVGDSLLNHNKVRIALATAHDRDVIYRLRHEVFAHELGQHPENDEQMLTDALDDYNVYITATLNEGIIGFISITPPAPSYSIDKYLSRDQLPFPVDDRLHELRLLAVIPNHRGSPILPALIYAAFRWVEAQGGTRIMAIGRREILDIYVKAGMRALGRQIKAGAVTFELITATIGELKEHLIRYAPLVSRLERSLDWHLDIPFYASSDG
jgi:GNAT superfamily N-acetyltransferase